MTKFVKWIMDQASQIDPDTVRKDLTGEAYGVRTGEKVVGTATPSMLQLWRLTDMERMKAELINRRVMHMVIDMDPKKFDQKVIDDISKEYAVAALRAEAVAEIFWASAREEFLEAGTNPLDVREGGQIVVLAKPKKRDILIAFDSQLPRSFSISWSRSGTTTRNSTRTLAVHTTGTPRAAQRARRPIFIYKI